MSVQGQFIQPNDSRWAAMLADTPHDFYHRPEYVSFAAAHSGGHAQAFLAKCGDTSFLVPLVVRSLPNDLDAPASWRDASSPYGYSSPLLVTSRSSESAVALWQNFIEVCKDSSIVSIFLRSHPLLPLPDGAGAVGATVVREGETVVIDLSESIDELWHQTRENHRRSICKLKKEGFHTEIDNWTEFNDFIHLYRATMRRVDAKEEYLFSSDYFHDLKAIGHEDLHLCSVLNSAGETVAAGLFFSCRGIVQFHLSGTAAEYTVLSPTKLMFDVMRRWAKSQGCVYLHLGGGVGCRNDSLFAFKAGFSKHRADFHTVRMVCDPECYACLTAQVAAKNGGNNIATSYFPEYRQGQVRTL